MALIRCRSSVRERTKGHTCGSIRVPQPSHQVTGNRDLTVVRVPLCGRPILKRVEYMADMKRIRREISELGTDGMTKRSQSGGWQLDMVNPGLLVPRSEYLCGVC